ncbi:insulin-degrading enzyme-like 1, peroxisomal isoform X3 [Punica granatum]|uniref:Insulin-degrading enzyme-like 1, peroxisomal isoform X3 n=1 Tax=Punica granatum TaxID=22663 RepID=A0A6P8DP34_PUNGR|nr:insulin-degrading enzyme-like 1, peroxisomal isoform X3 [Punica granatum]
MSLFTQTHQVSLDTDCLFAESSVNSHSLLEGELLGIHGSELVAAAMSVAVADEIVKARNDEREYRRIVLKNSLEVLLISDPDTDKCAASMNVRVGYFSDPPGIEGLAHFLEHMLFFASEKYPLEDSFQKYITEHGGETNAFTSTEDTNYHFDVNADSFEEALDRFAQFFIHPLLSENAVEREIKAVDSENQKNLLSDARRLNQLRKHLSKDCHPFHKFGTGNRDSLDVRPKANGINIRDKLIKFYEENYSANLMNLVVYGKEPLDKLQTLVEKKFQDIRDTARSCFNISDQPLTLEHLQVLIRAVPICDDHMLKIEWPITPGIRHYKEIPSLYLGHLIGHEGEGSLFHILKKLGWAMSLWADEKGSNTDFSFFEVSVDLTDAGQEHMEDIVGLLFKYIHLIEHSGICKWILDEMAAISEMAFHYQDKTPPLGYSVGIASNMKIFPPRDWLVKSSLSSNFNPVLIRKVLGELSPTNCRFDGQTDLAEPWYGTAYSIERLMESSIKVKWIECAPDENVHLPVPNQFIASDMSLKNVPEKVKLPVLLRKSPFSVLWYKPDTLFSVPKASVKIRFRCPSACYSPEAELLTDIFTWLLSDYLNEYAYYAEVANLGYGICSTSSGFQVSVSGYNHKLRILLETVLKHIANFEVKPDRFSVIKERLLKNYQNFKFKEPWRHALYYCSSILYEHSWPMTEELEILMQLEPKDVSNFIPTMLSRAFLECFVAGNMDSHEAELIIKHVEDTFFVGPNPICKTLFPSQYSTGRVVKLDEGMSCFYSTKGLNPDNKSSALVHYIQTHQDDSSSNVKLQLLHLIAEQEAFHQLRSVEQLGYITTLARRNDCGVRGLQFIIQSTSKDPKEVDSRVEHFLRLFESKLYEMTNDEFKSKVNELIADKLEKFKNLWEECSFYWAEIYAGTFKFDRVEAEVSALRQLTHQELIDFFNEHIKVGAAKKKTLSLRVYGSLHTSEFTVERSETVGPHSMLIDDILRFKRSQPLYGSFTRGFSYMQSCRTGTVTTAEDSRE